MNVSRIAVLGVALVAGAGAFVMMIGQKRPSNPVQVVEPVKEETVRVLIATRVMQRGERFDLEASQWVAWPKKAVQPEFITDANDTAREDLQNAVARTMIVAGEPILNAKIVRPDGSSGLMAAILSPGMRAVTTRVTEETSSGGFILPGDRVDILYSVGRNGVARTIFEDVRVLAVNTAFSENMETSNIDGSNVTLEMNPVEAEAFISARGAGSVSLVLRSIFEPEESHTIVERRSSNVSVIRYGRS